ncbi:MAG TPA: hypothetical protein VL241_07710, partial [Gemmatimonadales bacterium]|nr:hypothetical protein [Gemmatimonadales bacterium]
MESPLALARVELAPRAMPRLAELFDPRGAVAPGKAADPLVALLDAAGLLTRLGPGTRSAEDRDPAL